jgi:hypothetical protein
METQGWPSSPSGYRVARVTLSVVAWSPLVPQPSRVARGMARPISVVVARRVVIACRAVAVVVARRVVDAPRAVPRALRVAEASPLPVPRPAVRRSPERLAPRSRRAAQLTRLSAAIPALAPHTSPTAAQVPLQ